MPVSVGHVPFIVLSTQEGCARLTQGQALELPVLAPGEPGAKLDLETSVTEVMGTYSQTDRNLKWAAILLSH